MVFGYFTKEVAVSPSVVQEVDNIHKVINAIPVKEVEGNIPVDGSGSWTEFTLFKFIYNKTFGAGNGEKKLEAKSAEQKQQASPDDTCPGCGECNSCLTFIDLESSSEGVKSEKKKKVTAHNFTFNDDVIVGDKDIWIEQSIKCKKTGRSFYYYHSMKTGKNMFGSPPTGALVVIYEMQLPMCHQIIQQYVQNLPRPTAKIILAMDKVEKNDYLRNDIQNQLMQGFVN